jgi:hypothetical protein
MLDITTFPIVYVTQSDFGSTDLEIALESLIARRERFVLITSQDSAPGDTGVSPEKRKRRARWLKTNGKAFAKWCAATVIIEGQPAGSNRLRTMRNALAGAFGFRLISAATINDAQAAAQLLLSTSSSL